MLNPRICGLFCDCLIQLSEYLDIHYLLTRHEKFLNLSPYVAPIKPRSHKSSGALLHVWNSLHSCIYFSFFPDDILGLCDRKFRLIICLSLRFGVVFHPRVCVARVASVNPLLSVISWQGQCAISNHDFPGHPVYFRWHDNVHDSRPSERTPIPLSINAGLICRFYSGFAVFARSHVVRYCLRSSCSHLHD